MLRSTDPILPAPTEKVDLPWVVVWGGGFGGLKFCQKFPPDRARVTVVDRQNHHLFQPHLYQVATAGLSPPEIAPPIRAIVSRLKHLQARRAHHHPPWRRLGVR